MHRLSRLKKPTKIFILLILFVTLIFLAIIVYLEVTNNSVIESMSHYFVGDTESEITIDEVIPYEKQEIKDDNLDEGITETRQEGKDGKKVITFRVTKDKDGNEINRVFVKEEVVTEAIDEIIAIGTKVKEPEPANNNYNQGGWANNGGSQSYSNGGGSQASNGSGSGSNTDRIYYCTNWLPTGGPNNSVHVIFVKINKPCEKAYITEGGYRIEISSDQFYAAKFVSGPDGFVLETRYKECVDYWTNGGIEGCKK